MTCVERCELARACSPRAEVARERAQLATEMLAQCRLCAYECGVNRLAGEQGLCRAGAEARFFSAQVEAGDETQLLPVFAVALSGCNLRCAFCISSAASWNARAGELLAPGAMATQARQALAEGARTVMVLGGEPTIHLPSVLRFVAEMPATAKLAWKTNAFCSAEALGLLEGMFDVWVADYKFGNDACARRLAQAHDYLRVVRGNLRWANEHSQLIVRHLLLPGHVDCCWRPIAEWLANELPGVEVSLRGEFWPTSNFAAPLEVRRLLRGEELARATSIAEEFRLNLVD